MLKLEETLLSQDQDEEIKLLRDWSWDSPDELH